MSSPPLATRALSDSEKLLKTKFAEAIAAQSEQMDQLGRQLITLELAIPGLYATVLKLISGDKATLPLTSTLVFTFVCWFIALLLTLFSLIPKKWTIDPNIMKQDPAQNSNVLGIEDFFTKTAQYKRRLLISATIIFFIGIVSAATTIF